MPRDNSIEVRVIELLTNTDLTFKEIIQKLEEEGHSATIGIIRRINRDHRYRQPRYDSKLTLEQRERLIQELKDCSDEKPNLSLLAKRYGVCHGSVWYWWDKLNRIKDPNRNPRKPPVKHHESLLNDPNHNMVGRVQVMTKQGLSPLPILMFTKRINAN